MPSHISSRASRGVWEMQLSLRGTVNTGIDALDYAVSELSVMQAANHLTVVATSGANGGLSSFSLSETGVAAAVDHAVYDPTWAVGASPGLAIIDDGYGGAVALFGTTSSNTIGGYAVSTGGTIGTMTTLSGFFGGADGIDALAVTADNQLLEAGGSSGFSLWSVTGGTLNAVASATADTGALLASVSALVDVSVAGADVVVAASPTQHAISSFTRDGSTLAFADLSGPDQGVGIMSPTDIATAEIAGTDYVVVASAAGNSGALSVFMVSADGTLTATDHVLDTLTTRFGGTTSVAIASYGGASWVLAGGNDDGASLFALLPGGQLQLVDTIVDTTSVALANVSAIAGGTLGDTLRFLVASQSEGAMTDLAVDLSAFGRQIVAVSGGGTISGSGDDDIIVGRGGDDTLAGGNGDDIIIDGAGSDNLTGGNGRDVFVLRDDTADDTITDFNPTVDRLDLASWPMLHDPGSLEISTTSYGARIAWRDETLFLHSDTGRALDISSVRAAVINGINRPLDLSGYTFPDDKAYDITGTDGDDILRGGPGSQTIAPGLGNDTIYAGDGDDIILKGVGLNTVNLQAGNDTARDQGTAPQDGGDNVFGGGGNDVITTGIGDDYVEGGTGDDLIRTGGGRDTVVGGAGFDVVFLGSGSDRFSAPDTAQRNEVHGGAGRDRITGGIGNDVFAGDSGSDVLKGDAGSDTLSGGDDTDKLYGGSGNDTINGDADDDILFGGKGSDTLNGGLGSDVLRGNAGDDSLSAGAGNNNKLFGGDGNDSLFGAQRRDLLEGGAGADRLAGGMGNDKLTGGEGSDWLMGQEGKDYLTGGAGTDKLEGGPDADHLFGGAGKDRLAGGLGNDRMSGGAGADEFYFKGTSGEDKILDFHPHRDVLHLVGTAKSKVDLHDTHSGLVVSWGHNEVTLVGLDHHDFHIGWIDFS